MSTGLQENWWFRLPHRITMPLAHIEGQFVKIFSWIFSGKRSRSSNSKEKDWIVGILVPEDVIYSQLTALKWTYGMLTLVGILLIVFACLQFATGITRRILELKEHAAELAEGNLSGKDLMNLEADELGDLGRGFNAMKTHIKELTHYPNECYF